MKAVICQKYGPPSCLMLKDVPSLVAQDDELIIDVKACGLNFPDSLIIQGKYQFQPDFPFSPGGEVSGIVKSVGAKVSNLKVGDRVVSGTSWGGFAEEVRALATNTFIIPDQMPFDLAAASLMTYATVYHGLVDRARVTSGETVMVLGGAGGIGTATIQIAKLLGCTVIAGVSNEQKMDYCKSLGADYVINYSQEDIKSRAKELTAGAGVDVIVDPIGGNYTEAAFRSIARFGRYLVVGFAVGHVPSIPLNLPLLKSASIVGVFWGSFFRNNPKENRNNVEQLMKWFDQGALSSKIYKKYRLEDFEKAFSDLSHRKIIGKAVLIP